jgi:hypothetical protein
MGWYEQVADTDVSGQQQGESWAYQVKPGEYYVQSFTGCNWTFQILPA